MSRDQYEAGRQAREECQRLLAADTVEHPLGAHAPADPEDVQAFHAEAVHRIESRLIRGEIDLDTRWEHLRLLAEKRGVLLRVDWREYVRADGVLPTWAAEAMKGGPA